MVRTLIGSVLGGLAMWLVGFLFWATPLNRIALSPTNELSSVMLQRALKEHLGGSGTGTYVIPWPMTSTGTTLYGHGPIATIHFNSSGFAVSDPSTLIGGLILAIVTALVVAFALRRPVLDLNFGTRVTMIGLIAAAITAYTDLGQPIFNHAPWTYYIYLWVSDVAAWVAAGAMIAWWLPQRISHPDVKAG